MSTNPTLTRLREANPFPHPASVDAPDLFARIVALPADPRLRQRRGRARRRALVLALAIAAMALLASSAFALSNWLLAQGAVTPRVTKAEYRAAQQALPLPPGSSWPALHFAPRTVTSPGAGGSHAVLVAENAWECYWVSSIERGDTAAQQRAQSELQEILDRHVIVAPRGASENWTPPDPPKAPYAIFADDGGLQFLRKAYAQAANGHPQQLIESCRANAPR